MVAEKSCTLKDSQIAKLVGVTKNSVTSIRNKSYWNYNNLNAKDPVEWDCLVKRFSFSNRKS